MINLNKGQYVVALENLVMDDDGSLWATKNKVYKFIEKCTIIDDEAIEHGIVDQSFASKYFRQATQKEIEDYLKGKMFVDDVELEELIITSNISHLDLVAKVFDWIKDNDHDIVIIKEIKFFEPTIEGDYQVKIIYQIIK